MNYKKYSPVNFTNVDITGGFWAKRQKINAETTVFAVRDRFAETGRFEAFKLEWKEGVSPENKRPHIFWDSDIAKWIESAAYIIAKNKESSISAELEKQIDETVEMIVKNQGGDGYFNIFFQNIEPENRFTKRDAHELYCAGHLMEAAVAYYDVTGKDEFLKAMCKYADYIEKVFVFEESAAFKTPGHEEIELALVKLYHATGEKRYLNLSKHFIDARGQGAEEPLTFWSRPMYNQSHLPVREQKTAEGHSVRACYLYSGMADVAREFGDEDIFAACEEIFKNIVNKRMYITGGIGSSHIGEAFTVDYDLPNAQSYAETCAAISLAMFAQRMLLIEPKAVYADTVERVLYNGFLSGLSLDGKSFFYENPLEIMLEDRSRNVSVRKHDERFPITRRQEVFSCSCCPPNVTRFIAALESCIYTSSNDSVYIHQYMDSAAKISLDGREAGIEQHTAYPFDGAINLKISGAKGKYAAVRIPEWCESYTINGATPEKTKNGYAFVKIDSDIDEFRIDFEMNAGLVRSHPMIAANNGKAALMRGPLVYCMESADNGCLKGLYVKEPLIYETAYSEELDCTVIDAEGYAAEAGEKGSLYFTSEPLYKKRKIRFIPYYAFANRDESDMKVWFNTKA